MELPDSRHLKNKSMDLAKRSVDSIMDQCYQAWIETRDIVFPDRYDRIKNVIFCGMGGSSLPSHILTSAFDLKVPHHINEGYTLPAWAGSSSLVILSSYSGNTEEILSCAEQALNKQCLITGLTTGGKLKVFFDENYAPYYHFNPKNNPSGLPRFGIGYGIFGLLGMLLNLKLVEGWDEESIFRSLTNSVRDLVGKLDTIHGSVEELLKKQSESLLIVISSGHLAGNGRTMACQLNETSKIMSFNAVLPEADHNLIEGFNVLPKEAVTVFLRSANYHPRNAKRMNITKKVLMDQGVVVFDYETQDGGKMQEIMETFYFTSLFSVGLAEKNGVDPLLIPNIEKLKLTIKDQAELS